MNNNKYKIKKPVCNYKKYIYGSLLLAIILLIIYIVVSNKGKSICNVCYNTKELFLGISTGLLTGFILFRITNLRDAEIRRVNDKIKYLSETINMFDLLCECVDLNIKSVTREDFSYYLDNIKDIKSRYKKIRDNKVFKNIDIKFHNYIKKNFGKGILQRAIIFKSIKDLKKYISDNKYNIKEIKKYLYSQIDKYYESYISIAYK